MIERKADRIEISAGEMRTVVSNEKLDELLPVMHETALEEIVRLHSGLAHIGEVVAATLNWPETNRRRHTLICLSSGMMTDQERSELERLERIVALRTDLFDPFDTEEGSGT